MTPMKTNFAFSLAVSAAVCVALGLTLTSCVVGPNYDRPEVPTSAAFKSPTTRQSRQEIPRDWWKLFNDPTLNQLEDAASANTGLAAAIARVTQARAAARVVGSQFYPVITFNPSETRSRVPINTNGGSSSNSSGSRATARTSTSVRIPFDLNYEVDIWGRVRRQVESADASVTASELDYEVVLQTLQADVAQTYFNIRAFDLQATILAQTTESYRRQVELTQKQLRAGLVGQVAAAQADAQLHATRTQQLEVTRQRDDAEHSLAILIGRPPVELNVAIKPLDLEPPSIPAGLPADLLRRRPDVAESEQNLIASNAQIGVAIAQFYPNIQLSGAAGFESFDLRHAVDWQNRIWSFGPSVSWPIFEGGKLDANLEQVKARYAELLADYRGSVLNAIGDVENSLTDLHYRADEARAQALAVKSSREYLRLSQLQYDQGLIGYLQVIDAERTLLTNELSAAQILNQRLTATVLLIKSLGGGWDFQQVRPAAQPATNPATDPTANPTTNSAAK